MKSRAKRLLCCVCSIALSSAFMSSIAVSAFAAEGGGITAILPDMNEFIPMLIAFIILAFILYKFAWPAIEGILDSREKQVRDDLEKSQEARIESEKVLAEYKNQLEDAKLQATQIVADAKLTGESVLKDAQEKSMREADAMIEKARASIESERKTTVSELQGSIADIAVAVTSKVVGKDLSDDEHRAIIERYVKEAGSFNAN